MRQTAILLTIVCLAAAGWISARGEEEPTGIKIPPQKGPEIKLYGKLKSITIPALDFRQANIDDVLNFLNEAGKEFDPSAVKTGVRFVYAAKSKGEGSPGAGQEPVLVTFNAQQVVLYDALKIICDLAGLKFRLKGDIVVISPKDGAAGKEKAE